jgi:hypothetical protein
MPQAASVDAENGTPWTAIAVGLAGACLLAGGVAAMSGNARLRVRRARSAT